MFKTLKDIVKGVSEWPITYTIPLALSTIVSLMLLVNKSSIISVFVVAILGVLIALQAHFGYVIFKNIISSFIIIYLISLYTNLIIGIHGYVTQPFMFSLASVTLFLAQTYSNKVYTAGLRSRAFWCAVLTFVLMLFKVTAILINVDYLFIEIIGLIVLSVYIFFWRMWILKAKKTKIIEPTILNTENLKPFKFIYIDNQLNVSKSVWFNGSFVEEVNAYPYIYNEVLKAREEELILVLICKSTTNHIYDVGQIDLNKSTKISYLYLEAKESEYVSETIAKFVDELNLKKEID